ncbi:phage tail assembly chaperone [Pseudomonas sp. W5-36]|uniref:phage tail assembly chaperone n=1 Tax=Pseudomonas sp. W5-36 TaxID=3097455 RepID=UPI00397BC32F
MFTVLSAREPRWADLAHTSITLQVLFEENKDTYGEVPFAASPDDTEPHGVELYERAVAGEFGEVQEPTIEMIQAQVMCRRVSISAAATARINELAATVDTLQDAISFNLATDTQIASLPSIEVELSAWRLYRAKLAQLDTQPGYPSKFAWPEEPVGPFVAPVEEGESLPTVGVSKEELPRT